MENLLKYIFFTPQYLLLVQRSSASCFTFILTQTILSNIWSICYKWRWSENINKRTCKTMKLLQYTFRVNWAVALLYVTTAHASESPTNMKINTLFMWTCFAIKWARGRIAKKNKTFSLFRGPFWVYSSHDLRCR